MAIIQKLTEFARGNFFCLVYLKNLPLKIEKFNPEKKYVYAYQALYSKEVFPNLLKGLKRIALSVNDQ